MKESNLDDFFAQVPTILYPFHAFELSKKMKGGSTFATTCIINELSLPAIMASCDQQTLQYFGVDLLPPQPGLQFRMLNILNKDFVMEIVLYFDSDFKVRLHLDPGNKIVYHFLNVLRSTSILSFHFYSEIGDTFVSSMTQLHGEHLDWLARNIKLCTKIKPRNKYTLVTDLLIEQFEDLNNRIYRFMPVTDKKILVEFTTEFMKTESKYTRFRGS